MAENQWRNQILGRVKGNHNNSISIIHDVKNDQLLPEKYGGKGLKWKFFITKFVSLIHFTVVLCCKLKVSFYNT